MRLDLEIVKRLGHAKGFVVLPKRSIVERTLAWLGRCRRLAKDWECLNRKALAFLRLASIRLMLRKLCVLWRWTEIWLPLTQPWVWLRFSMDEAKRQRRTSARPFA